MYVYHCLRVSINLRVSISVLITHNVLVLLSMHVYISCIVLCVRVSEGEGWCVAVLFLYVQVYGFLLLS